MAVMDANKTWNFSSPENHIYDSNKIRIDSGLVRLRRNHLDTLENKVYGIDVADITSDDTGVTNLEYINDGETNHIVRLGYDDATHVYDGSNYYVQIDLTSTYTLGQIVLKRPTGRMHDILLIQVSDDGGTSWNNVFNTDTANTLGEGFGEDAPYSEPADGKAFTVDNWEANMIRVWSGPSNLTNQANDIIEIEAYETEYWKDHPWVQTTETSEMNTISALTSVETVATDLSEIRYNVVINDQIMWFDSSSNVHYLDEPNYFKSNTLATILSELSTYMAADTAPKKVGFIAYLTSFTGQNTPELDSITIEGTYDDSILPIPIRREVFGYIIGAPEGTKVYVAMKGCNISRLRYINGEASGMISTEEMHQQTTTNADGYFKFNLIVTDFTETDRVYYECRSQQGHMGQFKLPVGGPVNLETLRM